MRRISAAASDLDQRRSSTNSNDLLFDKDAKVVRVEEVHMSMVKDRSRKRKWQTWVFVVAAIKYYTLSCVLPTSTIYLVVQKDSDPSTGL